MNPISETHNIDCMEYMQNISDNYFDLAIVDPPYGGANSSILGGGAGLEACLNATKRVPRTGGTWAAKYGKKS